MKHRYTISGMTCNHCRLSVKKALNTIDGVNASVTLSPTEAIIKMDKHVPIEIFQDALSRAGDFTIEMVQDSEHDNHQDYIGMAHMHQEHDLSQGSIPRGHIHQNSDHVGGHMIHMGNLKYKFWISLVLAIPIILLSPMMGMQLPFSVSFEGSYWIVLFLASFLYFYGGSPFLVGAVSELKMRRPAMMTLISMGITVSYIYSIYAFAANYILQIPGHQMDFFWELATLIVIMLLGHWIEMKAVGNAGNALQKMAELLPGSAHLVQPDGSMKDIPLQQIEEGQSVMVKAGEKVPADGKVISGETSVNESMITGEAKAIKKSEGASVIGGSVNGAGAIVIEITGTGESGYLAQVMKLVRQAQQKKSRAESISDKVAKALFYIALTIGVIAFIVWYLTSKDINIALERMVTVFIIACPHALGLAIPLVVARSTSLGALHGLLIRNRNAFETARNISVVTMDKTGTLTEGNFRVSIVKSLSDKWDDKDILKIMASMEVYSNHPLAIGILDKAKEDKLDLSQAVNITLINGTGLLGVVDGQETKIVTAAYLEKNAMLYDKDLFKDLAGEGNSISYLLIHNEIAGLIAQGDQIKPEAKLIVEELQREKITPAMLTGDNEVSAKVVAERIGISDVYASLLPENKEKVILEYQQKGKTVMMVGDGVNDAPALARADIGVAIGAGTDVAIDSADVILVKSNPYDIIHFLSLAKNTSNKMTQNLWWGAGYNIIAIPLAAGVLAPIGIILSPAIGAVLMSVSTVIVAINALMLRLK
ncbi:copper-translocating P-type ATPase [Dysgonomonas mossii]|uniref:Copper-translocating P-type ATPase n=1 Tax=Dysgonomonas mossii TaxID=163665 RepID=A0A4Y9ILP8_9BACT|nr:copper-translocating P-type ATPase [Dysgonomonas mossii]TFU88848.1 copper-translocating P-type ATPase [Dysgonomonas mossii]